MRGAAARLLGAVLLLAAPVAPRLAQEPAPEDGDAPPAAGGVAPAQEPVPEAAPGAPRYHTPEDARALLASWLGSGLCEELSLGQSVGGRELVAVQFGGWGQTPLAERTTVLLVGGLDGVSLAGSEAVVAAVTALLAEPDRLPDDVTFLAVPWANPDGLSRAARLGCVDGRNDRRLDDDRDGAVDEDGPDDLDGDGMILELLLQDPDGPWVRCEDGRFLRPARPGEAPRYLRTLEGKDDDGDGRYNEDGPGGVALERNFPIGWRGPLVDPSAGRWPLSEPSTRALATLAAARRTAVALFFQGNHGGLGLPGASLARLRPTGGGPDRGGPDGLGGEAGAEGLSLAADAPVFAALARIHERTTGRAPLADPAGVVAIGSPVDWLYASLGVLAGEVAVWGPHVDAPPDVRDARYAPQGEVQRAAELSGDDRQWARWLDDTRGGLGFVDWQPVDLGDGSRGLVGGWEPRTCFNPPASALPRVLAGVPDFVLEVARSLPRLDVELSEARREGELCVLRARVRNTGLLASGLRPGEAERALSLAIDVPEGVEVLAGELRHELPQVPGQGASEEVSWLFVAPEGSVFRVRVDAPWTASIVREVRL